MYALRHCLCSYILNFSSGEITIIGLCGRAGFVPRLKPVQNVNATGLSIIFSHIANVYWVFGHEILYIAKRL